MKWSKKTAAALLCGMAAVSVTACGGSGKADDAHTYSVWLYNAQDSSYYTDYSENPALQYLLGKEWNGEKINLEFLVPPLGSQQNNFETMMTSGDFPTMMMNTVADAAPKMYESDMILDITELVETYMPNYSALLASNQELRNKSVFHIDGEDRTLALYIANENAPYHYTGMVYRRDWIAKYGTNPVTGESFNGGYTDPNDVDSWEDNVVFPSGGTDPVYISDWEWMFEIFTKAQAELGITDSYCMSIYYTGYDWSGGLTGSFGESDMVWFKGSDGTVRYGGDSDSTRAYFQCLNHWYESGWLDPDFNERTGDMFYGIDATSVRQGKVGMWQGLESDLGGRLDLKDGGYTDGIYVSACAWPINDIYGTESCQNVEPWCTSAAASLVGPGFFIMEGADEKDLAALLTFLDYLYSEEGSVIRSLGLNAEQMAEVDSDFYEKYGLSGGAYTIGEDGRYVLDSIISSDSGGLSVAVSVEKLPGLELVGSVDYGYAPAYEHSMDLWLQYKNQGQLWGSDAMNNLSSEDSKTVNDALTKVLNYMELHAYEFIKGIKDIDSDEDWNTWCTMLGKMNYQKIVEILQPYVDEYPDL